MWEEARLTTYGVSAVCRIDDSAEVIHICLNEQN